MADFDDIRRGIAAKLRTVLAEDKGHVSAYFRVAPPSPSLQVSGISEVTKTDFGDGRDYLVEVEAVIEMGDEIHAQKQLDALIDAVPDIEENTPAGALFSRYQDDNSVLAGQPAACDALVFSRYRGQTRTMLESGITVLIGTWVFEVVT